MAVIFIDKDEKASLSGLFKKNKLSMNFLSIDKTVILLG